MPQTGGVTRFLRAAVKAGLRLQRGEAKGEKGKTVADIHRIKASIQKSHGRRAKAP